MVYIKKYMCPFHTMKTSSPIYRFILKHKYWSHEAAYRFYPRSFSYGRRVLPQHILYGRPEPQEQRSSAFIACPRVKLTAMVLPEGLRLCLSVGNSMPTSAKVLSLSSHDALSRFSCSFNRTHAPAMTVSTVSISSWFAKRLSGMPSRYRLTCIEQNAR